MENVIVHTSLPPDVEGPVTGYLHMQIPLIVWEKNFKNHTNEVIYVRVLWWGEKSNGSIFFPSNAQRNKACQMPKTIAKYEICSASLQFSDYLKDMGSINLEVLSSASVIGTSIVDVSGLKQNSPIFGKFPVTSSSKEKIAELHVKIEIQPVTESSITILKRNQKVKKNEDNEKPTFNQYQLSMKNKPDNIADNSDLITFLLEKAKNLREAMIISLLHSKSLEKFLHSETLKDRDDDQDDLIENVLGLGEKQVGKSLYHNHMKVIDVSESLSSSPHSRLAELNESFDSLPDDSVINELFYKDKNIKELSPTIHKFQNENQCKIKPVDNKSANTKPIIKSSKRDSSDDSSYKLFSEMKNFAESLKLIKVKMKNLKITYTQKKINSSTAYSQFEQNKSRTYILELTSPFPAKVESWDQRGHRKQYSNNLQFISRRIKDGVVKFNREITLSCKRNISINELLSKELIFSSRVRMHDIHKVVNIGTGKVKLNDIISAGSLFTQCSVILKDIDESKTEEHNQDKYIKESVLEIEIYLINSGTSTSQSESLSSSKYLSKTYPKSNQIMSISKVDLKNSENDYSREDISTHETVNCNIDVISKTDDPSEFICDFNKNLIINDVLYCLLEITDGRNFGNKKWLHVVFRLFFSKRGFFRDILYDPEQPQFCFTQIFPLFLNEEMLQRTNNNIMIIEIWERNDQKSDKKKLRGLCKLPLHCFYLVFNNSTLAKSHLLSKFPVISTSGYTPVIHPITNSCNGELNILFAIGTLTQIENAVERYSQVGSQNKNENITKINYIVNKEKTIFSKKHSSSISQGISHFIELSIESLGNLEINKYLVWGEAECYITYCFPSQCNETIEICLFKSDIQLLMPNVSFQYKMKHKYFLKENESLYNYFLKEFTSQQDESSPLIRQQLPIKLWGSFYNPYQRIELLALTYLLLDDVCSFVKRWNNEFDKPIFHTYKLSFQTNFTNSSRLHVDDIKLNLKYWTENAVEKEFKSSENEYIAEDGAESSSDSLSKAENIIQSTTKTTVVEILENPVLEKLQEINETNENVPNRLPQNYENIIQIPEKDESSLNENSVAMYNHHQITTENSNIQSFSNLNDFVFCTHIFIERALHLPLVLNKDRINVFPSSYVTFDINNKESLSTHVVTNNCNPIWDWHQNVCLKILNKNHEMNLIFKIWHAVDEQTKLPNSVTDKVLGFASVDFSLLFHGLNQISGWYNMMDLNGKCQGQIKINIIAQNREIFQECTSCVIQPQLKDWNNKYISPSFDKKEIDDKKLVSNPAYKSLKEHMNELDLLYSQLMEKLVDLSSPIKISENAATDNINQIEPTNTSEPVINTSNSLNNQIVSLHYFKLIESRDKTENSLLTDNHQYLSKEFIIKHANSSNVITETTNHSTVTEDCVIASKQKNTPTQIHTKCISASLLHNNLEHEDEQCHYSNEFLYAKKIINEKDTEEPVDVTFMVKSKEVTDDSGNEHRLIVTETNKDKSVFFDISPIIQTDPNLHKNNNNS